jgi:hypothetical protein
MGSLDETALNPGLFTTGAQGHRESRLQVKKLTHHRDTEITGFYMLFRGENTWYKYRTSSNEYPAAENMIYPESMTVFNMSQQARVFPRPSPLVPRTCL